MIHPRPAEKVRVAGGENCGLVACTWVAGARVGLHRCPILQRHGQNSLAWKKRQPFLLDAFFFAGALALVDAVSAAALSLIGAAPGGLSTCTLIGAM